MFEHAYGEIAMILDSSDELLMKLMQRKTERRCIQDKAEQIET